MTELSETAHVLTHTHKRKTSTEDGDVWGDESPLLDLLADALTPSGQVKAGGTSRTGVPVDLGALDLWTEITRAIDQGSPYGRHPALVRAPYTRRLQAWVNTTTDPTQEAQLLAVCQQWVGRIRELLEPTHRYPLPGVACMVCGHVETSETVDGETVRRPILVAYPTMVPVTVVCTSAECGASWAGLSELGRFRGQALTLETAVMI